MLISMPMGWNYVEIIKKKQLEIVIWNLLCYYIWRFHFNDDYSKLSWNITRMTNDKFNRENEIKKKWLRCNKNNRHWIKYQGRILKGRIYLIIHRTFFVFFFCLCEFSNNNITIAYSDRPVWYAHRETKKKSINWI